MTRDEFDSRYRLLGKPRGETDRTCTAEHRGTGRRVLVHFFAAGPEGAGSELRGLLERLAPSDRSKVLETLEVDDSVVFVTQPIPEGQTFERWLRGAAIVGAEPDPGEFTALFRAGPTSPQPPAAAAPPSGSEARPPGAARGPSFTEMFRSPAEPTPKAAPGPADPAGRQATPPVRIVGLRLPTPPAAPIEQPHAPPIPAPQLGDQPHRRPAASPPPDQPVPRPAALYLPDTPAAPAPEPSPWAGPSDFTRQLSPGSPFSAQVPVIPAPGPPPEASARKASHVPLFLALNLAFIIITGLVVYFALRRC